MLQLESGESGCIWMLPLTSDALLSYGQYLGAYYTSRLTPMEKFAEVADKLAPGASSLCQCIHFIRNNS
jgi:hypothetical protein